MELHAQPLGVHVFAIVVSRCDLRHGILNSTLHQFDQLYFIGIYFTNTTSWDGTFPATVNTVTMSYGTLETIPSILERDIPASMVALRLSSHPFQAFEIPPAWHLVRDLRLVNLSHVVFDPTTLATFDFIMLVLAFANLTTLPPGIDAMSHLATVDVSGNLFDKAPRTLLSRQVQVIACGNPINLTEPLDPPQRLNFDWTQSTSKSRRGRPRDTWSNRRAVDQLQQLLNLDRFQSMPAKKPKSEWPNRQTVHVYSAWLRRLVFVFAGLKHTLTALYLAAQVVLLRTANDAQIRSSHLYAQDKVEIVYGVLGRIHMASFVHFVLAVCPPSKVFPDLASERPWPTRHFNFVQTWKDRILSSEVFFVAFNVLDVISQSYEAFALATKLVDRRLVSVYVLLVVLYITATAYVLLANHSATKLVLLNWASSLISFGLSSLLHYFGLILPLLYYKFVDPTLESSPTWLTHYILYIRYNFITSATDLVAKGVVQLGSLVSLWRLVDNINMTKTLATIQTRTGSFFQPRRARPPSKYVMLYVSCTILWAIFLALSLLHAMWFRASCPASCMEYVSPLWTSKCQCMYVHVNCHLLGHQDVEKELQASQLSSNVFAIMVSRCDLTHGISNATLNQFQELYFVGIHFTNMTSWDGQLPPSINFVTMSYGHLETLPSILQANIPESLIVLRLASHRFQSFEIPPTWHL
ncbi:unnamed protein product, partial [Aphanomyces euteiches]